MKLLTLAACLLSLPFALADEAPVSSDNPRHVGFQAALQADKPVQGTMVGVSGENGTGVLLAVSLFSFPDGAGPFEYHIHEKPVPSNGSCNATGGHLNPFNGTKPPGCDPEIPSLCEVGDLSGKYGLIDDSALASGPFFQTQYLDHFLSTSNDSLSFFGNRSFVIHASNGTRLNCGNFVLVHEVSGSNHTSSEAATATHTDDSHGSETAMATASATASSTAEESAAESSGSDASASSTADASAEASSTTEASASASASTETSTGSAGTVDYQAGLNLAMVLGVLGAVFVI